MPCGLSLFFIDLTIFFIYGYYETGRVNILFITKKRRFDYAVRVRIRINFEDSGSSWLKKFGRTAGKC